VCKRQLLQQPTTQQGPKPSVWVYSASNLQQLATLPERAELRYHALALSRDGELLAVATGEPGPALAIWQWRKQQLLASVSVEHPITKLGFHPADPGKLLSIRMPNRIGSIAATSQSERQVGAEMEVWTLERLWTGFHLAPRLLRLKEEDSTVQHTPTCFAWSPEVRW